jgi:ATP-binding cassette, subfamily B, bacterial
MGPFWKLWTNNGKASADPPMDWHRRIAALRNVPPLLRMVWQASPGHLVWSTSLRMIGALIPITTLWISKLIIDRVVRVVSGGQAANVREIWFLIALELALAVLLDAAGKIREYCDRLLADRFNNHVALQLMKHASGLDLITLEQPEFYDKLERARTQSAGRLQLLGDLGSMCQSIVTLVSYSAGILWFSPLLFTLLTVSVIPAFIGEVHFATLTFLISKRQTPQWRELEYIRYLGASHESAKEVRLLGLDGYLVERYRRLAERCYQESQRLLSRKLITGWLLALAGIAGYYSSYVLIVSRALSGQLSLGSLTFLAGTFLRASGSVQTIFSNLSRVADQALFLTDLFEFLDMKPTPAVRSRYTPMPRPIRAGFEFHNVSFRYAGNPQMALKKMTFRIGLGERIALVGANGAGKTTIAKLLTRLYEPVEGRITLDGVDLREYSQDELRKEIGVIFQDFVRFEMLVKENIGLGRVEEMHDPRHVQAAAHQSFADCLIHRLPNRYDQMLGRRFDGGIELSGGEWQKIALARAYMRRAQLLVLDEPTAALDAKAEYEVFRRFVDITRDRMAVLISHRLSTVRMADRILMLENGEIVEQGTHPQLLSFKGHYAEMFHIQASGYR